MPQRRSMCAVHTLVICPPDSAGVRARFFSASAKSFRRPDSLYNNYEEIG